MKKEIHPTWHGTSKITCVCGEKFEIGSTLAEMKTELCSACHPFYTGKANLVDTAGRIDKFRARAAKSKAAKAGAKKSDAKKGDDAASPEEKSAE